MRLTWCRIIRMIMRSLSPYKYGPHSYTHLCLSLEPYIANSNKFGHNDQKAKANISLSEYAMNLGVFVDDVRAAGGTPILVTPLTRRSFSGDPPRIVESLSNETLATMEVAEAKHARFIDLNSASTEYCNAIGPDACHVYNLEDGGDVEKLSGSDNTHLNVWGSVVFGRMISDLMTAKYWDIRLWTKPNATLTWEIEHGIAA